MSILTDVIVPPWARWIAILALAAVSYAAGRLQEARHEGAVQAAKIITVVKHEVQTVTKVETVYRDRIQKIYVQEKEIEADIPRFIPPSVDAEFAVPAGFLRVAAAGWSGAAPGPTADADREPSGVQFSDLAHAEVGNAASCRAWREQALGWRVFYAEQQRNFNGRAGEWSRAVGN